jgi:hypothetical protein
MKYSCFLFVASFVLISFAAKHSEKSIKQFDWLKGSWTMKKKNGGAVMENWQGSNDSTLTGESLNFSVTGASRVMETLQLVLRKGTYYYISAVKDQNNSQPVTFTIISNIENGFVAENPEHDFPKRITYNLINKDSSHAFIDGGTSMPDKKVNFYYSKYI